MHLRSWRPLFVIALGALAASGCQRHTGDLFAPPPTPAIVSADQNFGQVVNGQYVVAPGDTVAVVSTRTNTPIRTLIDLNKLTPPYALQAGQRLAISGGAVAAAQTMAPAAGAPQPKPFVPAATPTPIGTPSAPAPQTASAPQDLGGGVSSAGLPPLQGTAAPAPAPASTPQTAQIEPQAPAPAAKSTEGEPLPSAKPSSSFIWPVDGRVIGRFGQGKDNQRNDGINIAAPTGAPVLAAADGVVAYAGNELKGFGNMVLLRHADGWVTAYAHNSSVLVQKGGKVKQGQTIARVGSSGNVDKPQLHFELRQGTKAVDPMKVLTH